MTDAAVEVVLGAFSAVERRDEEAFARFVHRDAEFLWPPSLPSGGAPRARDPQAGRAPTFEETWAPVQPTEAERRMNPRIVAASDDEVVVLWHQRGLNAAGIRLDGEVLGLYRVRDGKLARAQMFYFDPDGAAEFLRTSQASR